MRLKVANSIFICATVLLVAVAGATWATDGDELVLAKSLVSGGVRLDATRKRDGKTALALAEEEGYAEIVAFLKEAAEGKADAKEDS